MLVKVNQTIIYFIDKFIFTQNLDFTTLIANHFISIYIYIHIYINNNKKMDMLENVEI
jgi:hypothetical protein